MALTRVEEALHVARLITENAWKRGFANTSACVRYLAQQHLRISSRHSHLRHRALRPRRRIKPEIDEI